MHLMKTGALIRASLRMGALCILPEDEDDANTYSILAEYGHAIGLAFQIGDDILDVTRSSAALGKTAGKDVARNKPTYVSTLGLDASRTLVRHLRHRAIAALRPLGINGCQLRLIACRIANLAAA
jgi:farnesyl diphosphate synthase